MDSLLPSFRRQLRARAHALHPVVSIGQHGLTDAVLHEIDVALKAHELIKVRIFNDDRVARDAMLARICDALACAPVQQIGKLLVLWRRRPSDSSNNVETAGGKRDARKTGDASHARRRRRAASIHPTTPVGSAPSRAPAGAPAAKRKARPAPAVPAEAKRLSRAARAATDEAKRLSGPPATVAGGTRRTSRTAATPPGGVPRAAPRRRRRVQ